MNPPLTDAQLDTRIRHTLAAVADTVDRPATQPAVQPGRNPRPRRRRRLALGLGALAIAVPATAAAVYFGIGPEYVDQIPPDHVLAGGTVGEDHYWMTGSVRDDECGQRDPGVELVVESLNRRGQEWNTVGETYGDARDDFCGYDTSAWLADPARWESSGLLVHGTSLVMVAAHPDVTDVHLELGDRVETVSTHRHGGAGYAVFEVPPGVATYTVSLLEGDRIVPGSTRTQTAYEDAPG